MINFLLIILGVILLFFGGEWLVKGSVSISEKLKISKILIGTIIVGFGTSSPELLISIQASLINKSDIALGNIVGSNIANILFITGLAAVISPITLKETGIFRDVLAVTISSAILFLFSYLQEVSKISGIIIFVILIFYLYYSCLLEIKAQKKNAFKATKIKDNEENQSANKMVVSTSVIMIIFGIGMLMLGANFLLEGAANLARNLGVSESVIGLSIVAFGTSLPEVAVAISASIKKQSAVIVGSVLGSNLFNIHSILGITAIIEPIKVTGDIAKFDIPFLLCITIILFIITVLFKKISKFIGAIFLTSYLLYFVHLFIVTN